MSFSSSINKVESGRDRFSAPEPIQEESFYDTIPESIAKRIYGLKSIQNEHNAIEKEFHNEILALERKFAERYQPLYAKRLDIISGKSEPTAEQIEIGKSIADEDEEGFSKKGPKPDVKEIKGIPEFWLTCLKNNIAIGEIITNRDEEALLSLVDIKTIHFPDSTGYSLAFVFSENEFFTNKELLKTYYFKNAEPTGTIVVDRTEGTNIDWKEGKNLTVVTKARKQRTKGSGEARLVKRLEPTESFFNFFAPKDTLDNEEDDEDLETQLAIDFELAETIKDKIILHAVDWYTGLALEYEGSEMDEADFDGEGYDCASSDEEGLSNESEDENA